MNIKIKWLAFITVFIFSGSCFPANKELERMGCEGKDTAQGEKPIRVSVHIDYENVTVEGISFTFDRAYINTSRNDSNVTFYEHINLPGDDNCIVGSINKTDGHIVISELDTTEECLSETAKPLYTFEGHCESSPIPPPPPHFERPRRPYVVKPPSDVQSSTIAPH